MRRLSFLFLAAAAIAWSIAAHAQGATDLANEALPPVLDCRAAADMAEQAEGLPHGLLFAIGKIESGRPNPATGQIEPWPYTTNQGGVGHYFGSAAAAIAWTSAMQARGASSIDVGCFQVNMMYHPEAFSTLEDAFDPLANARYAARFLAGLYRRAGGWPLAVAQYHSADPSLGGPYGNKVYSAWNGTWPSGGFTGGGGRGAVSARVNLAQPAVVRFAVPDFGIRVILPSWATATATAPMPSMAVATPAVGRAERVALRVASAPAVMSPIGTDPHGGRIASLGGGGRLPQVFRP